MTKRLRNKCATCGYSWSPRGHHLSRKCPNCGSTDVKIAPSVSGCAGLAALAVLILGCAICCGPGLCESVSRVATGESRPGPATSTTGSGTSRPTLTSEASPDPTADIEGCLLGAVFEADVTIPDDTVLTCGDPFTKTWRLRNTGTCAWGAGYRLVFVDGDPMDSEPSSTVPETLPANAGDVSVLMVAPSYEGQFRGAWRICVNETECFGDTVYVQIVTVAATLTLDPGILGYFQATDELLLQKTVELAAVGELLDGCAASPALYYTQDWYDAMEYHILGWYEYTDRLERYSPVPAAVSDYHAELLLMVADEDQAQDYLLLWIDTPDSRLLDQASARIDAAGSHAETAEALRESLGY
jgi:hypothetical protein